MPGDATVFVYGTLLAGCRNAHILRGAEYLGTAVLPGFAMYDLGTYPGIVPAAESTGVPGELYSVSAATLQLLDELEEEGSLYARRQLQVGGRSAYVYVYLGSVAAARLIDRWPPC